MKLVTRCIPLGALPYETVESVTRMAAKLFEKMPFVAVLPKISESDNIIKRTFDGIPGIKIKDKEILVKTTSTSYKQGISKLEKAFNHPTLENLEPFAIESPFMEKYFQMITKFNSPNAIINLLGPFTTSQILTNAAEEEMLVDKSYRKLFVQAICVKALWTIEKIKTGNFCLMRRGLINMENFCDQHQLMNSLNLLIF